MAEEINDPHMPVTVAEVTGWFPTSKFGKPDADAVQNLTFAVERTRQVRQVHERDPALRLGSEILPGATKDARALQSSLKELRAAAGDYGKGPEIKNLLAALEVFLSVAPGNSRGGQEAGWINSAAKWSPLVVRCLERPSKQAPSLNSDAGPVTAVLARAVYRAYGLKIDAADIGRRLRGLRQRKSKLGVD